jgi:hypothetical protein
VKLVSTHVLPNHNLREEALGLRRYDRGRVISSDDIGRWKAEHIKKGTHINNAGANVGFLSVLFAFSYIYLPTTNQ